MSLEVWCCFRSCGAVNVLIKPGETGRVRLEFTQKNSVLLGAFLRPLNVGTTSTLLPFGDIDALWFKGARWFIPYTTGEMPAKIVTTRNQGKNFCATGKLICTIYNFGFVILWLWQRKLSFPVSPCSLIFYALSFRSRRHSFRETKPTNELCGFVEGIDPSPIQDAVLPLYYWLCWTRSVILFA